MSLNYDSKFKYLKNALSRNSHGYNLKNVERNNLIKKDKYGVWVVALAALIVMYFVERDKTNESNAILMVFIILIMFGSVWTFLKIQNSFKKKTFNTNVDKTYSWVWPVVLFLILTTISFTYFGLYGIVVITVLPLGILVNDLIPKLIGIIKGLLKSKK